MPGSIIVHHGRCCCAETGMLFDERVLARCTITEYEYDGCLAGPGVAGTD